MEQKLENFADFSAILLLSSAITTATACAKQFDVKIN